MTNRTPERLKTLEYILSDGLTYPWFGVTDYDEDACTATVWTADEDSDDEEELSVAHKIGPDDVARGLRMVREYFNGERELYKGEWAYYLERDPNWTPTKGSTDSYL